MSLSTQTLKRLSLIEEGLENGLSREQIGQACGVTEKTIDRDMNAWVESGLFEIWLKKEFVRLHTHALHDEPMTAYQEIAKLVGKMLTRKIESKTDITETKRVLHLHMWKPEVEQHTES